MYLKLFINTSPLNPLSTGEGGILNHYLFKFLITYFTPCFSHKTLSPLLGERIKERGVSISIFLLL
jgi:hypothetical protein